MSSGLGHSRPRCSHRPSAASATFSLKCSPFFGQNGAFYALLGFVDAVRGGKTSKKLFLLLQHVIAQRNSLAFNHPVHDGGIGPAV